MILKKIALTCSDLVAAEAHYHISCYRAYTKATTSLSSNKATNVKINSKDKHYKKIEHEFFKELVQYFRKSIVPNKQCITFLSLKDKLISIIKSKGIEQIKDSTKIHMKRNLIKYLGTSLKIVSDHDGKPIAVPNTVTFEDLVKENQRLKNELDQWKISPNHQNIIEIASRHLRKMIKNDAKETPWPLHPHYTNPDLFLLPEYLKKLFVCLLSSDGNRENHSQRVQRLTQSFNQDIIYAVTCGKQRTQKHVLLS